MNLQCLYCIRGVLSFSSTVPSKFIRNMVISSITHEQFKTIYIPEKNTTSLTLLLFIAGSRACITLFKGIYYTLSDDQNWTNTVLGQFVWRPDSEKELFSFCKNDCKVMNTKFQSCSRTTGPKSAMVTLTRLINCGVITNPVYLPTTRCSMDTCTVVIVLHTYRCSLKQNNPVMIK